jgi:hypothetical protein
MKGRGVERDNWKPKRGVVMRPLKDPELVVGHVFSLGDVADILKVPKTRIKNWTIGRPFKIVPKVLAAHGKGSRNLYSLDDLYLFALVNQLHEDGLSNSVVQLVVDSAFLTPKLGDLKAFHLTKHEGKWQPKFMTTDTQWENIRPQKNPPKAPGYPGVYSLDVGSLIAWVNGRVVKLRGRG